jgi:hypothetical protein
VWSLKVGGGDEWVRFDRVRLNGEQIFEGENAFDNPCTDQEIVDLGSIFTITEEGTYDIEMESWFEGSSSRKKNK